MISVNSINTYPESVTFNKSTSVIPIEEHTTEDIMIDGEHYTKIQSNYPSQTNPLYTDTVIYDKYGRLEKIEGVLTNIYSSKAYIENDDYVYSYPADATVCKLASSTDHITEKERRYAYLNDKLHKIGEFDEANTKLAEEVWQYDAADRPTKLTYTTDGCNVEENITYTTAENSAAPANRVSSYTYTVANKGCANVNNTYDKFHRVTAKAVTVGGNDISKEYIYEYTRLSRVLHSIGETQIHNYMLGYDSLSRITSETDNKVSDYDNTYVYDAYGQLVRENNKRLNKTILYTYDNIGNVTRVQKYDYTAADDVIGTPVEDVFVYSTDIPDRLTSFNGKNITYDANGRVSTYGGWKYTWEREKLKSIEHTNSTDDVPPKYTFTYNAYGERTSKTYTHVKSLTEQSDYLTNSTTNYKYDLCGRLIKENRTLQYSKTGSVTKELTYLYEGSEIIGLVYTTADGASTYYYDKNVYGDVISILDNAGNTVVKYKYDAYGNCEYYDSVNADLAETNPIRYRGYYYDTDTGLYYLQARYYNPEWRRFISQDSTSYLEPEILTGLNLYAYCNNDPVNYVDPSGHSWESFWNSTSGKILGTILIVGAMVVLSIATAGVGATVVGTLGGGFWAAVAGGAVGGAISGAICGAGISMVSQGVSNGYSNIDYGRVGLEGLVGMASGAFTGAIFAGIGRGLGLLGKTKWAQRTLNNFDDVSKNYMFGSKSGSFTFFRNGKSFRLESSLQHGLHYHALAAGTTAPKWNLIFEISNSVSGLIGGHIGNGIY